VRPELVLELEIALVVEDALGMQVVEQLVDAGVGVRGALDAASVGAAEAEQGPSFRPQCFV
jgi:hypothetical protein